jgi:hypothetical protein
LPFSNSCPHERCRRHIASGSSASSAFSRQPDTAADMSLPMIAADRVPLVGSIATQRVEAISSAWRSGPRVTGLGAVAKPPEPTGSAPTLVKPLQRGRHRIADPSSRICSCRDACAMPPPASARFLSRRCPRAPPYTGDWTTPGGVPEETPGGGRRSVGGRACLAKVDERYQDGVR